MKKRIISTIITLFTLTVFTACGGGGGSTPENNNDGGNIDNVIVDEQAYYIDAVNGNDQNDGKTPGTAWKSLNKINSTTINAGNKILFRTGQKWQGTLEIQNNGTAEKPIVIGSYGKGEKPVLSALGTVQIHENNNNGNVEDNEWIPYTAVGGNGLSIDFKEPVKDPNNTWLAVILNEHPYRVKVNGQEIVGAFDSMELGPNFKWHYNIDKSGTVFYYYGNDKPNSIETNIYSTPLYIHDNAYVKVENIALEGGYVAGLFIENAQNITVENVTTGDMSKQGIYVKADNAISKNIIINNCTIDSRYTVDYSMAEPNKEANGRTTTTRGAPEGIIFYGGVQNSTIANSLIKNWTHANINMSAENEESLSNNKIYGNILTAPDIAYGGRIGIDGKNTANNEFYNNTIKDIKAPIQFNGHDNSFHDNSVEDIKVSPLKPNDTGNAIIIQAYSSPVYNISIINNTFKNIAKKPEIIVSNNNQFELRNIVTEPNTYE